jgi:hypothetical protein
MKKLFYPFLFLLLFFSPVYAQLNMTMLGHLTYSNDLGSLWDGQMETVMNMHW